MADTLADVEYQVAVANRVLWALGLATGVTASLGHASLRAPEHPARRMNLECGDHHQGPPHVITHRTAVNNTVLYDNCDSSGQPGNAALGGGGRVVRDDTGVSQTYIEASVPDPDKGGWFIQVTDGTVSGDYVSVVCSPFPVL
jgi:hypothetical protein